MISQDCFSKLWIDRFFFATVNCHEELKKIDYLLRSVINIYRENTSADSDFRRTLKLIYLLTTIVRVICLLTELARKKSILDLFVLSQFLRKGLEIEFCWNLSLPALCSRLLKVYLLFRYLFNFLEMLKDANTNLF